MPETTERESVASVSSTYQVAYGSSRDDLEESVRKMMFEGWVPQGGICVVIDEKFAASQGLETHYGHYQAMVRTQSRAERSSTVTCGNCGSPMKWMPKNDMDGWLCGNCGAFRRGAKP